MPAEVVTGTLPSEASAVKCQATAYVESSTPTWETESFTVPAAWRNGEVRSSRSGVILSMSGLGGEPRDRLR